MSLRDFSRPNKLTFRRRRFGRMHWPAYIGVYRNYQYTCTVDTFHRFERFILQFHVDICINNLFDIAELLE
jgi:hypothetical protein